MTTHTDDFHDVEETSPSGSVPSVQGEEVAGHTKGPWATKGDGIVRHHGGGGFLGIKLGSGWIEGAWSHDDADAETLANARLIAAAPELLEALRGLVDVVNRPDAPPLAELFAAVADGQAAISRATGGSR